MCFIAVKNPSFKIVKEILEKRVREKALALLVGCCKVSYHGRASSELGLGDRVVIIKCDGSVLVHRKTGYSPVNWQPPNTIISHFERSDGFLIRAVRQKPRETLEILFKNFYFVALFNLKDEAEFTLEMSEEEVRRAILKNPGIILPGFRPLEIEKDVGVGYIDIYGVDKDGEPVVVEIKRGKAEVDAVKQLERYVEALSKKLGKRVKGVLVASSISKEALLLLKKKGFTFRRVKPDQLHLKEEEQGSLTKYIKG